MNTQWDVTVPDSTLAAYVDDALAPLLNGKKDEKPAAATTDVKHLAPGEERTRRHTMPSIPSCAELFVSTTDVRIVLFACEMQIPFLPCYTMLSQICHGPVFVSVTCWSSIKMT